jgi:hypothetical protein
MVNLKSQQKDRVSNPPQLTGVVGLRVGQCYEMLRFRPDGYRFLLFLWQVILPKWITSMLRCVLRTPRRNIGRPGLEARPFADASCPLAVSRSDLPAACSAPTNATQQMGAVGSSCRLRREGASHNGHRSTRRGRVADGRHHAGDPRSKRA